jgi:hypothetical protein
MSRAGRANDVTFHSRMITAALCFVFLVSASCGSDVAAKPDAPSGPDERSCQGDVGMDCLATYDEVLAATWTCQDSEMIWAGECMTGGPFTFNHNWGTYQTNCFYDRASRKLVGANVVNDVPMFCGNTSASMSRGDVPVPYPHYCVGNSSGTDRSMNCGS